MKLNDPASHRVADQEVSDCFQTNRGKRYEVKIKSWPNQIRRGTRTFKGHKHPFHLFQCVLYEAKTGQRIYQRPLWLSVCGQRRSDLSPDQVFESDGQRYDLAYFFRFSKQHLLIDAFQTPEVEHEKNGWQIALIAY